MTETPHGYDSVTLHHWLWWKLICHEATGEEFQLLFEKVIRRVEPRFMAIRAYGNIGDRKCDGLYFEEGVVFQVYSPDSMRQGTLIRKIEEDLGGAVEHWSGQLKRWVFVYNVRRGLPPDVPGALMRLSNDYPNVELDHLDADALWEKLRALPLQARCEVLGAPVGFEHLFLATNDDAGVRKRLALGAIVVIHDVLAPVNVLDVVDAMLPRVPIGPPVHIRPHSDNWQEAALEQQRTILGLLERSRGLVPRFHVFALSPIPLLCHLGFLLSECVEVVCHQYDRVACKWTWPDGDENTDAGLQITGLPEHPIARVTDVVLRVSLSDVVRSSDTAAVVQEAAIEIDLAASEPDVRWLRSHTHLVAVRASIREVLKNVRRIAPDVERLHLFYAGPAGGAVAIGQVINPRMDPLVITYEYSRQGSPRYRAAVTLGAS